MLKRICDGPADPAKCIFERILIAVISKQTISSSRRFSLINRTFKLKITGQQWADQASPQCRMQKDEDLRKTTSAQPGTISLQGTIQYSSDRSISQPLIRYAFRTLLPKQNLLNLVKDSSKAGDISVGTLYNSLEQMTEIN